MVEIIGIGALNMDRLYLVERIAEPGEEVMIDAWQFIYGYFAHGHQSTCFLRIINRLA